MLTQLVGKFNKVTVHENKLVRVVSCQVKQTTPTPNMILNQRQSSLKLCIQHIPYIPNIYSLHMYLFSCLISSYILYIRLYSLYPLYPASLYILVYVFFIFLCISLYYLYIFLCPIYPLDIRYILLYPIQLLRSLKSTISPISNKPSISAIAANIALYPYM